MASPATFTENNSPGEYATLMTRTNTPMESFVRENLVRVTRHSAQTTSANGIAANVPMSTTTDFHFIPIQGIAGSTVNISGLDATFLSPGDITPLGETTETHFSSKDSPSALLLGVLLYLIVQLLPDLVTKPMLTIWSTPAEAESSRLRVEDSREATEEEAWAAYRRIEPHIEGVIRLLADS